MNVCPTLLLKVIAALLVSLLSVLPANAARLALIIGNKDYAVGALRNPLNDADAIAQSLRNLGFQITPVANLRRDDIGRTVEAFANTIRPGDDVVVFYAGHGLQVKGVNYLPAVDARIQVESDVALNSLNLNDLLQRLDEAKAGVRLLLIDACRDNPYSRGIRSSARGLARVEGAPSGTLMHFATRPGSVADDGQGNNGLYTEELLKHLSTPGLPVESMLKRVASGVRLASNGNQQPWTEGALMGEFYFAASLAAVQSPTVDLTKAATEDSRLVTRWVASGDSYSLSPIVVTSRYQTGDYEWTIEGRYPAKRGNGDVARTAEYIEFWGAQWIKSEWIHLPSIKQLLKGGWSPGEAFVLKVHLPAPIVEGEDHFNLRLCMGDQKSCYPSPDLHPRSKDRVK